MFRKDVTSGSHHQRGRMNNRSKDRRVFSDTASGTRRENTLSASGNPKRGGIRL